MLYFTYSPQIRSQELLILNKPKITTDSHVAVKQVK